MFSVKKSSESLWSNAHVTWKTEVQGINSSLTCSGVNRQQLGCSQAGGLHPGKKAVGNIFRFLKIFLGPKAEVEEQGQERSKVKVGFPLD